MCRVNRQRRILAEARKARRRNNRARLFRHATVAVAVAFSGEEKGAALAHHMIVREHFVPVQNHRVEFRFRHYGVFSACQRHFVTHQVCHLLIEQQNHEPLECGAFVGVKECRAGCCFPINGIDGAVLVLAVVGFAERPDGRQNEGFRFQLLCEVVSKTCFAASVGTYDGDLTDVRRQFYWFGTDFRREEHNGWVC